MPAETITQSPEEKEAAKAKAFRAFKQRAQTEMEKGITIFQLELSEAVELFDLFDIEIPNEIADSEDEFGSPLTFVTRQILLMRNPEEFQNIILEPEAKFWRESQERINNENG